MKIYADLTCGFSLDSFIPTVFLTSVDYMLSSLVISSHSYRGSPYVPPSDATPFRHELVKDR